MKTVLVVDDDADIRTLITWKLSLAGYETIGAGDGEEAVLAANGGSPTSPGVRPDLVLLDWTMPKMSGIEVCEALRAEPSTAHIPIILLTAKAQEAELTRGLAAGADDYIVKPFSPKDLLSRVSTLLGLADAPTPEPEPV
ncbi:MAG: two-component system, OmpR family, alkaline phosphatase synthesis response regulator PhoP [Actinomycetota bacterium]|jgi:DNA-binding response OmpR family regulator|nr:two-component system, OmpR family, alkaline phosphatase synthesis response regulator PhoP [Actinomycetota bacterium]MEA2973473.1 two-component system, OmpR family, alkaline phosphatase synthesis response regulator PhoP [Actinomycetota bacterium]